MPRRCARRAPRVRTAWRRSAACSPPRIPPRRWPRSAPRSRSLVALSRRAKRALGIVAAFVVVVGVTWGILAAFVYDVITFKNLGPEMEPGFGRGARLLVDRRRTPERGDVVVVLSKEIGQFALRRVVGLPGDTYAFVGTRPVVNGVQPIWQDLGY